MDIIKSGGYKLSALEIEPVILTHPAVMECAVVGVPDKEWGERVAVIIALHPGMILTLEALRAHCKTELTTYKLPTIMKLLSSIPRNAMGKINKKMLLKEMFP